jgi:succinate dehydrogenase/fumarate reductase cytochrome b subunit
VVVDCYVWVYPPVNVNKKLWKDPPFFMGKSTISMAIFNSYVKLPEGISWIILGGTALGLDFHGCTGLRFGMQMPDHGCSATMGAMG